MFDTARVSNLRVKAAPKPHIFKQFMRGWTVRAATPIKPATFEDWARAERLTQQAVSFQLPLYT